MNRYLFYPFRAAPLTLVITFTLGWMIAFKAGFVGIPLGLLLLSWFFKYCFIVMDAIVVGAEEPPVLSIEMVNPIDEQRPLAQAALIVGAALLAVELGRLTQPWVGWLSGLLLALLLPASIATMGLSSNPFLAAWPPGLIAVARGIGRDYALLIAAIGSVVVLMFAFARSGAGVGMSALVTQLGLLLIFALVGGALHEHRLELGIEYRTPRERRAERSEREHASERNRMLGHAYSKFRVSKPLEGWQEIQSWLNLHAHADDLSDKLLLEHRAVLAAAALWDDVRAADRLTDDLVELYFARRETGRALDVVEERLTSNPNYRPKSPTHTVRLLELATAAGKRSVRRQLGYRL
jgi:hypothetical protein